MVRAGSAGAAMAVRRNSTEPLRECPRITRLQAPSYTKGLLRQTPADKHVENSGCGITGAGQYLCCWVDVAEVEPGASHDSAAPVHDPFQVDGQEDVEPESAR